MTTTLGGSAFSFATQSPTIRVVVQAGPTAREVVLAGLVGGATILIGVIVAESLVRVRERRRDLDTSLANHQIVISAHLPGMGTISRSEFISVFSDSTSHLARIRNLARWPIKDAGAIRAEVGEIRARLVVALADFRVLGTAPKMGAVIGPKIAGLVRSDREWSEDRVDDALRDAGYPSLSEWDDGSKWHPKEQTHPTG